MIDEPDRLPGAPHPRETAVLFGQEAAERLFLDALSTGRLHHAWMLAGPRGTGKATLAWRIARHLIGGAGLDTPSDHPAFRQLAALGSPQLFLGRRPWDEKAERLKTAITVDEIRALGAFFHLSAADGGQRVAIIDAADEMTPQAANALLKVLEEPPARSTLLLVTHRPAALLPTIRSRTRTLRLAPLDADPLARALAAAGSPADPRTAPLLAALAGGSVGAAFRLAADEGPARYAEIVEILARSPLDRRRAIALAEAAGGRQSARYELTLELVAAAVARLARAGAGAPVPASTDAEREMAARLAPGPAATHVWADLAARLADRTGHARAVNLDPAQVILDTLLEIDAAAARARARAA